MGGVDEERAFDRLMGACPELLADAELAAWVAHFEEEGEPDRYVRLAALDHHLVDAAQTGRVEVVRDVLDAAEAILAEGDADAVELVRMGVVEPIQNICSHADVATAATDFVPLLGERTRQVWEQADQLWDAAGRWAEETPRVTIADYDSVQDPGVRRYLRSARRRMPDDRLIAANDIVRYQTMLRRASGGRSPGARSSMARLVLIALAVAIVVLVIALV